MWHAERIYFVNRKALNSTVVLIKFKDNRKVTLVYIHKCKQNKNVG